MMMGDGAVNINHLISSFSLT